MKKTIENFNLKQRKTQIIWRKGQKEISCGWGCQNGKAYEHILPRKNWEENLWSDINTDLPKYIKSNGIQKHSGVHNLVSSWIVSANLYYPIIKYPELKNLMLGFLKTKISSDITEITDIQFEFAFPKDNPLHPAELLGEQNGNRGAGQTSPDVAFLVKTKTGKGIILTECKFTEHSFYPCSARRKNDRGKKKGNPDPLRCMIEASKTDYKEICHQTIWGRKYWSLLNLSNKGKKELKRCPAATAGYQLFRQQALAEGIAQSGKYALVVSTVAFDKRNKGLIHSMKRTGIPDFQKNWDDIFKGNAKFKTWTHQEWVQYVRDNQSNSEFNDWLKYLKERYDY